MAGGDDPLFIARQLLAPEVVKMNAQLRAPIADDMRMPRIEASR
jgi:hypothetical protein